MLVSAAFKKSCKAERKAGTETSKPVLGATIRRRSVFDTIRLPGSEARNSPTVQFSRASSLA